MDLLTEAKEIQAYLEIEVGDDVSEAQERGSTLQVYMARTGKMLADAKKALNLKKQSGIMDILRETSKYSIKSATGINELIKSVCADEQYLVDWCERLNRTCTHQADWCRTLISKYKEEMRMNAFGGGM